MARTTIQVDTNTREKLAKLKIYRRETYDEIILRLIAESSSNKEVSKQQVVRR